MSLVAIVIGSLLAALGGIQSGSLAQFADYSGGTATIDPGMLPESANQTAIAAGVLTVSAFLAWGVLALWGFIQGIVAALAASPVPEAQQAAQDIASKSPVSLAVTLRSLRRAATLPSLEAVLDEEYRVSVASLSSHDLVEGIRAQVVDKDRNPQWQPATSADVTAEDVDRYFAPLGDAELGLSKALTEGEQS